MSKKHQIQYEIGDIATMTSGYFMSHYRGTVLESKDEAEYVQETDHWKLDGDQQLTQN